MNRKDLSEMPRIAEHVKNRFINAVKKHHGGTKWRVLKQEIENALQYYIEVGPLSDECLIEDPTTGDVGKIKLTIPEFFRIFDNEHIYVYDRITAEYLKGIVSKITDNGSDYNWRKWSKIIRESGRLRLLKGTPYYQVNRNKFFFIEDDLKASYDVAINQRQLESYNIPKDHATGAYNKLIPGQTTNLEEISKLGGISENEAKKVIKKLESEHKLQIVRYGLWKVLDPGSARTLRNNSLFEVED